jgi:hypothetical protein
MKFRREVGFRLIIAGLGLMASILQASSAFGQANAVAQPAAMVGPAALQQGELEVWVPKTHVMGIMGDPTARVTEEYPWTTLLNEFNRDFPEFKVRFKILEREDFLRAFHSTEPNSPYPDMAFVDNGRELDPLVSSGAVVMKGRSRFAYGGWWLSLPRSKNVGAAQAFMLWLSRSPHWKAWKVGAAAMSQTDITAVQTISRKAVEDISLGDVHSLSANMDRESCHFDLRSDPTNKLVSVDSLITFGNSRLAFELVSSVGQGERSFGMEHSALVLRKVGDLWKVLLYLPGTLPDLEGILKSFDRLELKNGQPEAITQVSLVSPVDHARITRYPKGELEWKPLDPLPAAYVVEHQFGQPGRDSWSTSWILVVSPSRGESLISMEIPFGVGQQPHRWRVWAISGTGVVSTSDWRTVDFTN